MNTKAVLEMILSFLLIMGMLTLAFNTQLVRASVTIYIRADGSVEPVTAPIQKDGDNYTFTDNIDFPIVVERSNIVVDGAGYALQGTRSSYGILLSGRSHVTVKNIYIKAFGTGIRLDNSSDCNIYGNNITDMCHRDYPGYSYYGNGIFVWSSSDNVVSGNNLMNNYHSGIRLVESQGNIISENDITNNHRGIYLKHSSGNIFLSNNVTNNEHGIELDASPNNTLSWNNITDNDEGIYLRGSSNNTLRGNSMTDNLNNIWISGDCLSHFMNDVDTSNTVNSKSVYYWTNKRNMIVASIDPGYLVLVNCTYMTIQNLNLSSKWHGMLLAFTGNSIITRNRITESRYGIWLQESHNNTISGNNITNNRDGIYVRSSNNNMISENQITYNGVNTGGIDLNARSKKNNIYRNNITGNKQYGILLREASESNVISWNNITKSPNGIYLKESSNNNTILGNNIENNGWGVVVDWSNNDNVFYHNNFIDNGAFCDGRNFWDDGYPSGGNYWSNYKGVDKKGVGYPPRIISGSCQDTYPLMGPFHSFKTGISTYSIDIISNSTISSFHFNLQEGLFVRFNITGQDDTVGFCRVTIPNQLLWCDNPEQWQILVNNTLIEDREVIEDNGYTYIYFTYSQSTQDIKIIGEHGIPEFPTWTPMLVILIVLTFFAVIYKRRLLKTPNHTTIKSR